MHAKSAGLTGMAQGVIRLACINADLPYVTVPAATLKKFATGKGNATKADMRMAWFQRAGFDVRDDNQCDALWLYEIGLHLLGDDTALPLPKAQTDALASSACRTGWPHEPLHPAPLPRRLRRPARLEPAQRTSPTRLPRQPDPRPTCPVRLHRLRARHQVPHRQVRRLRTDERMSTNVCATP
jgi:hypothetical protein